LAQCGEGVLARGHRWPRRGDRAAATTRRAWSARRPICSRAGVTAIRLTVDAPAGSTGQPKRGYRRIDWIETAIEPLRGRLDDAGFERLVSALAMVIGWEALIVLQDLRGLTPGEQAAVSTWAARALIQAALQDQPETSRAGNQRPPAQQAGPHPTLSGDPAAGPALRPRPGDPT